MAKRKKEKGGKLVKDLGLHTGRLITLRGAGNIKFGSAQISENLKKQTKRRTNIKLLMIENVL